MGYTTEFLGAFKLDKPLFDHHKLYLEAFSASRRMQWDVEKIKDIPDPLRERVSLPLGIEGEYFVADSDTHKTYVDPVTARVTLRDSSLEHLATNINKPPSTQPSLWCQWVPTEDATGIKWDGGEKFYNYELWIDYLRKILTLWGYTLSGEVFFQGESESDCGYIKITSASVVLMPMRTVGLEKEWNAFADARLAQLIENADIRYGYPTDCTTMLWKKMGLREPLKKLKQAVKEAQ